MKTLNPFIILLALAISLPLKAQQLGTVELKKPGRSSNDMNSKDLKKAPKKLFIAEFNIFYQVVYADAEQTREGVNHGKTKASLTVIAEGIQQEDLQNTTDKLYREFVNNLKAKGYTLIDASAASGIKPFEGWELVNGGTINEAQIKGYAMTTPTGFKYYRKKVDKKGREKKGIMDNSIKISQGLDGTVVAKVNIIIPFMTDSESGISKSATKIVGGISKLVASPDLKLSAEGVASSYSVYFYTQSLFAYSTGMKTQAVIKTSLKNDVPINGVFKDEKFKATAVTSLNTEHEVGAYTIVESIDVSASNTQSAKCNGKIYNDGVYKASSTFLNKSLERFYGFTVD